MLKDEEIRIEIGRAVGGDCMKIIHLPTGICRGKGPPIGSGREVHEFRRRALREIERELREKGLVEYLNFGISYSNKSGSTQDEIRLHVNRLSVVTSKGMEYGIRWNEIYRLYTYRPDVITESCRVIGFDFENGEFIEVDDSMQGFGEMLLRLGEHVVLPVDYQEQVNATKSGQAHITLYRRP